MITRVRGKYIGRNAASTFKDLVWTVATAIDKTLDIEGQTRETLAVLESVKKVLWRKFVVRQARYSICTLKVCGFVVSFAQSAQDEINRSKEK